MSHSTTHQVCVVDDDPDTRAVIRGELESLNFSVIDYPSGVAFLEALPKSSFQVLILDVGLPDIDGFEICRRIRSSGSEIPILFVTSRSEEIDRVSGFALGADDYVSKPFSPRELGFRVKAIVRRMVRIAEGEQGASVVGSAPNRILSFGPLQIDIEMRRVTVHENLISLTALEFDVLLFLAMNPGRPFSRDELMGEVWGMQSSQFAPTVTTLLNRLRRKIESDARNPQFIITVFGVGYRFVDPSIDTIKE